MSRSRESGGSFPVTGESLAGVEVLAELGLDDRKAIAAQCQGRTFEAGDLVVCHLDTCGIIRAVVGSSNGEDYICAYVWSRVVYVLKYHYISIGRWLCGKAPDRPFGRAAVVVGGHDLPVIERAIAQCSWIISSLSLHGGNNGRSSISRFLYPNFQK